MFGTSRVDSHFQSDSSGSRGRGARFAALAVTLAIVAGCSQSSGDRAATGIFRFLGSERAPRIETLENTVEYTIIPPSRTIVSAPSALIVFERNLDGAIEQRIVLPNETAVRGDNVIHVRAQTRDSARLGEFNFDEIEARFGGLPTPFERLTASGLRSGSDSLGTYVYGQESVGTGTSCVLVLRRMGVGARPLPSGTQALDMVMRNCVQGSVQEALAPMAGGALGVGGSVSGGVLSLSPHAAPRG